MADAIFKSGRRRGFTTVYREVAQDRRLSLKARGLFLPVCRERRLCGGLEGKPHRFPIPEEKIFPFLQENRRWRPLMQ